MLALTQEFVRTNLVQLSPNGVPPVVPAALLHGPTQTCSPAASVLPARRSGCHSHLSPNQIQLVLGSPRWG